MQYEMMTKIEEKIEEAFENNDLTAFEQAFRELKQLFSEHFHEPSGVGVGYLHISASKGRLDFVKLLVRMGLDVNASDAHSPEGPIARATGKGHLEVVRWLLERGANINFVKDGVNHCAAVRYAARGGHLDVVKLLVEHGADFNAVYAGMNALSFAQMYGKVDVAEYLVSQGAKEPWQTVPSDIPGGHRELLAHVRRLRGEPSLVSLPGGADADPAIALYVTEPSEEYGGRVLFTVGMSDRPTYLPDGHDLFLELALCLPADWPVTEAALADPKFNWPMDWLRRMALHPQQTGTWPAWRNAVFMNGDPPRSLTTETQQTGFICLVNESEFGDLQLSDHRIVNFLSAYPIYTEEREFEAEHGYEQLVERFQERNIPVHVDLQRENVAL